MNEKQKEILKKNINLGGLLRDELDEVVKPALDKVVQDSANPWDDLVLTNLYPLLRAEIEKLIAAHVDTLFDPEVQDEASTEA